MKPSVLIVDDSLTVRMDLDEIFAAAGFVNTLCSTVAEARSALARNLFTLIILDVLLPDADGIEFLREIKSNSAMSRIPVILLSSEAEVRDRVRGLKTGADEYVGKPYDHFYIVARARELLRKQEPSDGATKATTILVIDDSPTFREELKSALESSGYKVITAATGEEGLRIAAEERPEALVIDGVLPGIDGAGVIRQIRADAALRRTPCILLTGSEEKSGEIKALDAGADDYVRKGENTQMILARMTAVLRTAGAPSMAHSTASLLGPKRILTVDDSLTYLQEVAGQLRQEGYDVIPAHSGEEALELLAVEEVDCILLDLVMPGLSGQETCRRIKSSAAWRDIPLIMHTAREEQSAIIEGINAGADDYIAKSSDLEVLRARVRAQLRRKQYEDENRSIREQLLQKELEVTAANAARELAEARAVFSEELEHKNKELETFSYSVSHDLRAPLRSIDGFAKILQDDYAEKLDASGQDYLQRICIAARRMSALIDDLLMLSRVTRAEIRRETLDLSGLAGAVVADLRKADSGRNVHIAIAPELQGSGDPRLLRIALENLFGNAWKFTSKHECGRIEFGTVEEEGKVIYFLRDDGAGFDPTQASKLFNAFQRLHGEEEFPGTGIGLATVQRIIQRHGGRIWAEGAIEKGSIFYFTL